MLLAAVVPIGWAVLKARVRSQARSSEIKLLDVVDQEEEPFIIPEEIKDLLSSSDSTEILQGLELLASTTNLISSFKHPNEDQDIEETIVQIIKEGIHSKELLEFLVDLDNEVIWKGLSLNKKSTKKVFLRLSQLDDEIINQNIVSNPSAPREVVLAAIQSDSCLLEYASEDFKADREVVLAAVKLYGSAL